MLTRALLTVSAIAALAVSSPAAEKWKMQFNHDEEKSVLHLVDIAFPSTTRGIAVGVLVDNGKEKPTAVLTSNGGTNWATSELPDTPVSLFFLNEGLGWMVTVKGGLWQTTEAGKNWRKLPRLPAAVVRVVFTSEKDGWAAGQKKKCFETHDGGNTWTPLAAAAEPPGNADHSIYNWIAFATPQVGLISGFNMPPRPEAARPEWMEPETVAARRDLPHLSYSLTTNDGGKTWKAGSASLFGEISRIRFFADGKGLGLIEHANGFRFPSEAYKIDWSTGKSETIYRDRRFHVTDIWMTPDGTTYLAGTQIVGQIRTINPGKVQVLMSRDQATWVETDVYYRAVAHQVFLAGSGEDVWIATDSGMILKLVK